MLMQQDMEVEVLEQVRLREPVPEEMEQVEL